MAAPADAGAAAAAAAAWQPPPHPGPGELDRAFAPLGPTGQAVLRALDAYATNMADENYDGAHLSPFDREHGGQMEDAIYKHAVLEHKSSDNPVPYRWQVGRFLRHAIDTHNVVGVKKVMRLVYGSTGVRHLVLSLVEYSLHPDNVAAVKLFQDVINALAGEQDIRWWGAFVTELSDAIAWRSWGEWVAINGNGALRKAQWADRVERDEYLAKTEKALAIGSPFPLNFDVVNWHGAMESAHVPLRVFRVYVNAFTQHDKGAAQLHTADRLLDVALLYLWRGVDVDECDTLVRHLRHFIELRRPALTDPHPQRLAPTGAQADAIQLLANHLARSPIGDARVLPNIMDFVRYIPPRRRDGGADAQRAAYRQREFQVAHAAVGRAQVAHASTQVATTAAPTATPALVPSRTRAREDEEGGEEEH